MNNLKLTLGPLIVLGWLAWWLTRMAAFVVLSLAEDLGRWMKIFGTFIERETAVLQKPLIQSLAPDSASSAPSAVQKSQITNRKS